MLSDEDNEPMLLCAEVGTCGTTVGASGVNLVRVLDATFLSRVSGSDKRHDANIECVLKIVH